MKKGLTLSTLTLIVILIEGCASTPKPSPDVTALLSTMDDQQATQVIRGLMQPRNLYGNATRSFITGHIGLGLCKASDFSLDERGADLQVTKEAISLNATKTGAPVASSSQGISSVSGIAAGNGYERIYYREHLRFDNIQMATVTEPRLLRTVCGRQSGQTEAIIRETTGRWYAALIPTAEKDRFMAALMRLRPDITLSTESQDDR